MNPDNTPAGQPAANYNGPSTTESASADPALDHAAVLPTSGPSSSAPWKAQAFWYILSQGLSLFGSSLVQYGLMWSVTLETQSGTMMMWFVLVGFIPTFLMSPFGGVWADRYDRRLLMALADGGIALATLLLALAYLGGIQSWAMVFVIAGLRALGTAVHQPASGALLPQFIPAEQLTRINGIMSTLQSVMMFAAPMISAALLATIKLPGLFLLDVSTAVLAIIVLLVFLKVPPHARAEQKVESSPWEDLRLGFRYIRSHRYLVPFFTFMALILFLIATGAFLSPLQVTRTFGADVWRLTAIEIIFSVGMMAGGSLMAVWGGFRNRMASMALSTAIMGASTLGLGLMTQNFWVYLIPMGIFGISLPIYNTAATVLIQEHVEPDYLGRVFSVLTMVSTSAMPLGMIVFGPLAEIVSLELIMVVTGVAVLVLALGVLLNRTLMAAGVPVGSAPQSHDPRP